MKKKNHKIRIYACIIFLAIIQIASCTENKNTNETNQNTAPHDIVWIDDIQQAYTKATNENKNILINFTGSDWCYWCHRLDDEVFSQKEFVEYANENLILMVADFPRSIAQTEELKTQNRTLAQRYEIRGYPTILAIDAQGNEIARTGYMEGGAQKWVDALHKNITENDKK